MDDASLKEIERIKDRMRQILWDYESGKLGERKLTAIIYAYKKYCDVIYQLVKISKE